MFNNDKKIVTIIVVTQLIIANCSGNDPSQQGVICFTSECIQIASRIRSWMNTSADPCEDFYEFSCGGFLSGTCLDENVTKISPFTITSGQIDGQLLKLLDSDEGNSEGFEKIKKIFELCVGNETSQDKESFHEVTEYFQQSSWNWIDTTIWLKENGLPFEILIDFSVVRDKKNTSQTILMLDMPKLAPIITENLLNLLQNLTFIDPDETLTDFYEFLNILKQVPNENETTALTFKKLQLKFNYLNWNHLFDKTFPRQIKFTKTTKVLLKNSKYFFELRKILKTTEQRVLLNYFLVKTLDYLQKIQSRNFTVNREKWCLNLIKSSPALASLYVRTFFPKIPKSAFRIIANIKRQLTKIIKKTDWMDSSSKIYALDKLSNMHVQVGYPDDFLNASKVDGYYLNLNVKNATSFIEAMQSFNKFKTNKLLRTLKKTATDMPRYSEVTTPNVFYDVDRNVASIPVAVMQGEFFSQQRQNCINYGSFGNLVSYGVSSAYGLEGYLRDRRGNSIDWWNDETKEIFINKTSCLHQKMDDEVNAGRIISDLISVKVAYEAYGDWVKKHPRESQLPFIKGDGKQSFWISMAQNHCIKLKDTNDQSSKTRVNTIVRNLPSFSDDFNCIVNSMVNSSPKKCEIF